MKIIPLVKKTRDVAKQAKRIAQAATHTPAKQKYYYAEFCKHCPVDERRMLFESFHGKSISDSSYAVLQEMVRQGIAEDYEIYYATNDLARDTPFVEHNQLPIKLVDINTRKYAYIVATAKYLLNNSSFPLWLIRRPEQVYVQTWHGTPLKTLGKEMRLGIESMVNVQHNFIQASWLTFPNDFTRDVIMRDYNLDKLFTGKVAMVGYPRNTVFMRGADDSLRKKYELDGFTTYAYMPTWRGTSNHTVEIASYADSVSTMLRELDARLTDNQKVFVNFHSMVAGAITLDAYEHIFPFPTDVGTYDFLAQMDVLITDYSSVMFDYALTRKPVVLFTYDEEQYLADRGMYFSLESLPFVQVKTIGELVNCLDQKTYALSDEDLLWLSERFLPYDTPENAQNVLALLLGQVPQGVSVIDYASNALPAWNVVDVPEQRTRADLNGIFLSSDPTRDLVLLNRLGFGQIKSVHLYDHFREYPFLFARRDQNPRTPGEEVGRFVLPAVRRRFAERERKLLFGGLTVSPKPRTVCVSGTADSTYSPQLEITMSGTLSSDGNEATVTFDAGNARPVKIMLATENRIRWSRDLTEQEARDSAAAIDVLQPLCSSDFQAKVNSRVKVCLLIEEADGARKVAVLSAPAKKHSTTEGLGRPIQPGLDSVRSHVTFDREGKCGIPLIDGIRDDAIAVAPLRGEGGVLELLFTYSRNVAQAYLTPVATTITTPQQRYCSIRIQMPNGEYKVNAVELRNRMGTINTAYGMSFIERTKKSMRILDVVYDPRGRVYDGIYWDVFVVVTERDGSTYDLKCGTSDLLRHSFYFRNLQCDLGDGNIVFPYATAGTNLALCHRPLHASDSLVTKAKEWAAMGSYLLLLPYWSHKRIWLVYEKFCSLAQDNGAAFFSYCMEDAPSEARKHVFYVMDKASSEYANVQKYGRNVIDFMSFRHMLYALAANIYVGSDSKSHLYQWRPKPSVVRQFIMRKDVFFLQHGVTALKRVDYLFGKQGTSPMTYFLTTSHAEQDVVVQNFGYDQHHAPALGFSRWDLLRDTSNGKQPSILLMPTWRQWLEDVGNEAFLQSDYFRAYSELIQSESLKKLLEQHNARLKFYIHPKLSDQLHHFGTNFERVELVEMGSCSLSDLIMECNMLITDYSSVCWDMLYLDKPVVFYQFDQAQYASEVGSYIDLNNELPGPVCKDLDVLVDEVKTVAERGFVLDEQSAQRAHKWFDFKDDHNRKRTYEFLIEEGL